MKSFNRASFALGVAFALAIVGCIAAVTIDGTVIPPLEIGQEYYFRSSGGQGISGVLVDTGPGSWVVVERQYGDSLISYQVNLQQIFYVRPDPD